MIELDTDSFQVGDIIQFKLTDEKSQSNSGQTGRPV